MIAPDMQLKLRRSLIDHEGLRRFPYVDSVGKITIGIGYNLTDRGLSDEWINKQYDDDVNFFYNSLMNDFAWFKNLDDDRKVVLIDMAFMGYKKLLTFKKMFYWLAAGDYSKAAFEMLDSKWAKEVKGRAEILARAMASGVYSI